MATNSTAIDDFLTFFDLSPLLSLFGDETTKQFLATSMGMPDNILLGVAPIGIPVIIVSAIRVGSSRLLKSLIGRVRDNPDDEEKETLSSTSANVREIWNGGRVVRQTGSCKTTRLIFDRRLFENYFDNDNIRCLQDEPRFIVARRRESRNLISSGSPDASSIESSHEKSILLDKKVPPNLTINTPTAIPDEKRVIIMAITGLLAQTFVMVINALGVYRWQWRRSGKVVPVYAYPLWAGGLVLTLIGICLCGWVVESSSQKMTVTAQPWEDKDVHGQLQIIFLQQKIPEQNIPTYMIRLQQGSGKMFVSKRVWPETAEFDIETLSRQAREASKRGILLSVGTAFTLSGFVCQNIGTRALHPSAGLFQVLVVLFVSSLRAWLRRNVGAPLGATIKVNVQELRKGFEASDFTTHITNYDCYIPSTRGLWVPEGPINETGTYLLPDINADHVKFRFGDNLGDQRRDSNLLHRVLNIQSTASKYEPSAEYIIEAATRFCNAMEEILNAVYPSIPFVDQLYALGPFLYMVIATRQVDSLEFGTPTHRETPQNLPLAAINFPHDKGRLRFLQAIISLTRHAHTDIGCGSMSRVFRILGHCTRNDVEAYTSLLRAWIPYELERFRSSKQTFPSIGVNDIHVSAKGAPIKRIDPPNTWYFGFPFRHTDFLLPHNKQDSQADFELVWHGFGMDTDDREYLVSQITLDIISSFLLKLSGVNSFLQFMSNSGLDFLTDVLLKHGVCTSLRDARIAVVPALIRAGVLYQWPPGYKPQPDKPKPGERPKWDDKEVKLSWPRRRALKAAVI